MNHKWNVFYRNCTVNPVDTIQASTKQDAINQAERKFGEGRIDVDLVRVQS